MGPADAVERIVLVGFMAAGKTTVGRRLAARLGWGFVDFDEVIEARTGLTVPEIFRTQGEAAFRALEAQLTDEFGCAPGLVLAPGGGWITRPRLLDALGPGSLVVWLRVSAEEAVRRALADDVHRPLLAGPDPLGKARLLLDEREPLYYLADAVVDVDGHGVDDVVGQIAGRTRVLPDLNAAGPRPDGSE
jgi:shikimate kinase